MGVCAPARELGRDDALPFVPSLKLEGGILGIGGLDVDLCPDDPPEVDPYNGLARSVPVSGVWALIAEPLNDILLVGLSGVA